MKVEKDGMEYFMSCSWYNQYNKSERALSNLTGI